MHVHEKGVHFLVGPETASYFRGAHRTVSELAIVSVCEAPVAGGWCAQVSHVSAVPLQAHCTHDVLQLFFMACKDRECHYTKQPEGKQVSAWSLDGHRASSAIHVGLPAGPPTVSTRSRNIY